jgi:ribosomal protein L22
LARAVKRLSTKGRGNRITKPTCHVFVTVGN